MSKITIINDAEQAALVSNNAVTAGKFYLKAEGSTNAGDVVIYNGSAWKRFANEGGAFSNAYSVSLDGSNTYMEIPTISELNAPTNWSFACWFRYQGTPTTTSHVIASAGSSSSNRFYIQLASTSKIRFGNDSSFDDISISTVSNTTWYHLALVQSGTTAEVYLNGSSQGSATVNSANTGWGTSFKIGRYFTSGFSWNGYLDEVALFNSALSASDVAALRDTTGSNPVPADISSLNPVAWWRMGDNDNGTGTTITDQGSGSTDATLVNGPTFSTDIPS